MKPTVHFSTYQILLFSIVFCACTLGPSLPLTDLQAGQEEQNININVSNKPLSDVSNIISAQTGYKIILDQALSSLPVSGIFTDITAEHFFSSVLKGENIVVKFDHIENSLTVISFGNDENNVVVFSASNQNNNTTILPDITLAELNALNRTQLANSQKTTKGSNIFGTNMTIGELDNLQRKQQEYDAQHQPKDEIIMGTDMTMSKINSLQEKQIILMATKNKNTSKIMGTNLTLAALNKVQATQSQTPTNSENKRATILGTDMTIDDINSVQGR